MLEVALQATANSAIVLFMLVSGLIISFLCWLLGRLIWELAKAIVASPLEEATRIVAGMLVFAAIGLIPALARIVVLSFFVLLFAEAVSPYPVFRPIIDWVNRRIDDLCGWIRTWRSNI